MRVWEALSRADVASSRMRMGGSLRKARARAIFWRWPPERWSPMLPTLNSNPISTTCSSTFSSMSSCMMCWFTRSSAPALSERTWPKMMLSRMLAESM